ncbi:mediator of RNA polymerase II transcription subunit 21 [Yarrowia lipolytica]|jgi:mediator of RNA polymerase II transcription subunit 21|nr:hypothetical protein YALI1_E18081g [Yarrowia lipolytica]KAB8282063.1 mediator of RNA polymerase II transcription subunit 21 [Yarrowia lipolytica]KAE8171109.1 mediator of RNA polymerase II transcription subunit 21 [Yarrowia lipolytica]RDW28704.1 mediator of RNA polymerase II transcription subunit 21 [Yarrowia lipolytica]RDW35836.1 mediator of RNA polymerase II transcription subunit 21 [Yarrowia lipolytica]
MIPPVEMGAYSTHLPESQIINLTLEYQKHATKTHNMADRLTQLQTCVDQMLTQYFSALTHINTNHGFKSLAGEELVKDDTVPVVTDEERERTLEELAKDLVVKSQQIDYLIDSLPGIGSSEEHQMQQIEKLQKELEHYDQVTEDVIKEKDELLEHCDELILKLAQRKAHIDVESM